MPFQLPCYLSGAVVKGFGRGSKELNCPTANMDADVLNRLSEDTQVGVYYGWAQVDRGEVHKMVMNIGWNPFYKNTQKTLEVHILNKFTCDFYGKEMRICILGFIRPEKDFSSLDELVSAIQSDIAEAKVKLEDPKYLKFKSDTFFTNAS